MIRSLSFAWLLAPIILVHTPKQAVTPSPLLGSLENGAGVYDLAVSADGRLLAAAGFDGSLNVWDLKTQRKTLSIAAHKELTTAVAFHPTLQRVASAGRDGTVKLWNLANGTMVVGMQAHRGAATDLAFSPDGAQLVSGGLDGHIAVWSHQQGEAGFKRHRHREMEPSGRPKEFSLELPGVATVDFSPAGQLLVVGGDSGRVTILRYPSLDPVGTLAGHTRSLNRAAFSTDGSRLVTASLDDSARIWDVATGKELHRLGGYTRGVLCATFSPNGKLVAVSGRDHQITVWDAATGRRLMSLPEQPAGVYAVVFSPRTPWVASGGWDGAIRIWDVESLHR